MGKNQIGDSNRVPTECKLLVGVFALGTPFIMFFFLNNVSLYL